MPKYLKITHHGDVWLYDLDEVENSITGLNQRALTRNIFKEAKREVIDIKEGLEENKNHLEDCRTGLLRLRDRVDAIFTSPPYCAGKAYEDGKSKEYSYDDSQPYEDYLIQMKEWMSSAYVALKDGGVFGLNISNIMAEGQKRPTGIDLLNIAVDVGFTFQEQIMWVKPLGAGKQRTGSYILSYQKYQDRLKAIKKFKDLPEPAQKLSEYKDLKKALLAKLRELKKDGNEDTDEYRNLDNDRLELNNNIRVLELLSENKKQKEIKQTLKDEASQVYRPNPITEYIWILTKGDDITNHTCIDLKQVKDQLYNVWYDKTTLDIKEKLKKSMTGSDLDKKIIKDNIASVSLNYVNKVLEGYSETISDLAEKALLKVRPKLKKESDLTPTKINRALKQIYEDNVTQLKTKMASQVSRSLISAIKKGEEETKEALAESFAVFWRQFTDNWDIAPTNTKVRNHPAPFSVDLPMRFIELYLPEDGLIVDPFVGSGSSAQAAVRLNNKYNRKYRWLGFDISQEYIDLANKFIQGENNGNNGC